MQHPSNSGKDSLVLLSKAIVCPWWFLLFSSESVSLQLHRAIVSNFLVRFSLSKALFSPATAWLPYVLGVVFLCGLLKSFTEQPGYRMSFLMFCLFLDLVLAAPQQGYR